MTDADRYLKMLCSFASTDVTRYHLNGVYRDVGCSVTTDGFRLIAVRNDQLVMSGKYETGKIYEAKAFGLGAVLEIEGKYPNWKALIPDTEALDPKTNVSPWTSFSLTIPYWFAGIKKKPGQPVPSICIDSEGNWTTGKGLIAFNMSLMAPLAGIDCKVWIKDAIAPMVVKPVVTKGLDIPWTAVIMPMRL